MKKPLKTALLFVLIGLTGQAAAHYDKDSEILFEFMQKTVGAIKINREMIDEIYLLLEGTEEHSGLIVDEMQSRFDIIAIRKLINSLIKRIEILEKG